MAQPSNFYARNRAAWRQWLQQNHATQQSIWLVYDKGKDRGLSYEDIVEEALCFGWVDSKGGLVSDSLSKLYISKRKPRSAWSRYNKARVEHLQEQGLMAPAGEAAVQIAKENGAWDQLKASDKLEEPAELTTLLNTDLKARSFYDAMPPSSKRIILEWIYSAKTEPTRLKRIAETVDLAAKGIKAHHYRQ